MRTLVATGVVILTLLLPSLLSAQNPTTPMTAPQMATQPPVNADTLPKTIVAVNLGGLATDFIDVSFYHALTGSDALGVLGGLIYYPFGHESVTGWAAALAYRFYPGRRALWRFYVSPMVGYQSASINPDTSASGPMAAAVIGWQWFPEGNLAVGMGFGTRYAFGGSDSPSAEIRKTFGFRPVLVFDMGYSW